MNVSIEYVRAFVGQLDALDERTARVIESEIAKRDLERRIIEGEAEAYDEIAEIMRIATQSSARMASALSARYYNGIRKGSNAKGNYDAESFDTVNDDEVRSATFSVSKEYSSGNATVPLYTLLGDVNSRFTRYSSNESIRRNAARDPAKPKYAIVPSPTACVFCQMRAGLGYQYATQANVESHNNCKCQAVPVFGNSKIQGYNPEEYESKYYAAKKLFESGKISDDLKERIEAARLSNPDFEKTNAVLMVWREMEKR